MKFKFVMSGRFWFFWCMLDCFLLGGITIITWLMLALEVITIWWILGNIWFWIATIAASLSLLGGIYLNWNKIYEKPCQKE